ncbi:MAG TPA: ABC transporter ATP-binding protein, partial [Methylophilaceae bacterium]|nr:ABC transporter ATP-binding protein [Methylophilaceae bacterium]
YQGGVVLVSHDRALLRATCDRFVLVADGRAQPFDGDLDDYRDWLAEQRRNERNAEADTGDKTNDLSLNKSSRAQSKAERQARQAERRPLLKESQQLENALAGWQREKNTLDERLADPALYAAADKADLQALLKRQAELIQAMEQAEERWLAIHEQLEALPAIN